jgi:ubiquinone/menaquinone biosynthesis C-methylase UbiE
MVKDLPHSLRVDATLDERSRQEFVSALRAYILVDMADSMRGHYERSVEPAFRRREGRAPADGNEVHDAIRGNDYFRFYSGIRYNAQEMVFRSVIPPIERGLDQLNQRALELRSAGGSLEEKPGFEVPRNVTQIDVHLSPGSYHSEHASDDVSAGAIYDNSINVFAFNQMGADCDDIGWTMAQAVRTRYPEFKPRRILDCGCTIGHNTLPWAKVYPDAEVHAIDVSAPLLRYASARAADQGVRVRFAQMNATALEFPDASMDLVFSSMFLHELPLRDIRAFFQEAQRVLRPGGLLLNMELPPNNRLAPYDQFYLDWDCFYNNEPFYKPFRDQDYRELCTSGGFPAEGFVEIVAPRYTYTDETEFRREIFGSGQVDDRTGVLAGGIRWYGFGAFKSQAMNGA